MSRRIYTRRTGPSIPAGWFGIFVLLTACLVLQVGCTANGGPEATASPPVTTANPDPTATPTPLPTPTETPLPPRALFIAPPDANPALVAELEASLAELAASSSLMLEKLPALEPADLTDETRMVVGLPSGSDITGLAGANPDISFITLGIPGVEPGPNLSVIGPEGFRPDQQGFAAGYLATMLTEDWRVAVVSLADTADGQASRLGFINGGVYYCGLCRPAFPPFVFYPTFADLPGGGDEASWEAATNTLLGDAVETVYLSPSADSPGLRQALTEAGFSLIVGTSGEAGAEPGVIARIVSDPAAGLEILWPEMLAGGQGRLLPMPISVREADPEFLSEGRLILLDSLISDLEAGIASTGVDPLTGEPR